MDRPLTQAPGSRRTGPVSTVRSPAPDSRAATKSGTTLTAAAARLVQKGQKARRIDAVAHQHSCLRRRIYGEAGPGAIDNPAWKRKQQLLRSTHCSSRGRRCPCRSWRSVYCAGLWACAEQTCSEMHVSDRQNIAGGESPLQDY